jgi:hypothetical protein
MKTKIILIGIALIGLVAGCGLFNSNSDEFDPSKVNGTYRKTGVIGPNHSGIGYIFHYYIWINYPHVHSCTTKHAEGGGVKEEHGIGPDTTIANVKAKITHIKKDSYKVKRTNGTMVANKDLVYTVTRDMTQNDAPIKDADIGRMKDGKEVYVDHFDYTGISPSGGYQDCINNANGLTDSIDPFDFYGN